MKTSPFAKLFAVALTGVLAACSSPSSSGTHMSPASPAGSGESLSGKLFAEVNSYRAERGKAALQRHPGLDRLAQQHCDYLLKTAGRYDLYGKNVSHMGFEGRALVARQTYQIKSLGENVVSSKSHSPKHLVNAWALSETHEFNMRNDWHSTGIATAVAPDGKVIATQLFGTPPSTSYAHLQQRFSRH